MPFCEKRFSFFANTKFWTYQNIISKKIINSVRKADSIIVQTTWIKDAICKKSGINGNKIKVLQPDVQIPVGASYESPSENLFFYPASDVVYKNHDIIYQAVRELKNSGYSNFKVILTINKNNKFSKDNKDIEELIEFCGYLDKKQLDEYYRKSVLLFPSYIESFGLPLLEARLYGCPIIASDCSFSREILNGYDKADFFPPFDKNELFKHMKKFL